ncbi:hypothetical protein BaRGS_00037640 [Batillaria attramentaria]|uniref:Uncharacterized protein n=1 Tax=Batillaria attramentaria TaxID=370345 RepID=A0ABD0J927_9CAEN
MCFIARALRNLDVVAESFMFAKYKIKTYFSCHISTTIKLRSGKKTSKSSAVNYHPPLKPVRREARAQSGRYSRSHVISLSRDGHRGSCFCKPQPLSTLAFVLQLHPIVHQGSSQSSTVNP